MSYNVLSNFFVSSLKQSFRKLKCCLPVTMKRYFDAEVIAQAITRIMIR